MVDRNAVEAWCDENEFELKECNGDGYDDGYEPKLWNGEWQTTSKKQCYLMLRQMKQGGLKRKIVGKIGKILRRKIAGECRKSRLEQG